jgi:hypothetical protein
LRFSTKKRKSSSELRIARTICCDLNCLAQNLNCRNRIPELEEGDTVHEIQRDERCLLKLIPSQLNNLLNEVARLPCPESGI